MAGVAIRLAEVALHFADFERALELLEAARTSASRVALLAAKRAEALTLAGDRDAAAGFARQASDDVADAFTTAVAMHAAGLIEGDDAALQRAGELFEGMGCVNELARTRWLRGGEHRLAAGATFERLGALSQT